MRTTSRVFAMLLALLMVVTLIPSNIFAAYAADGSVVVIAGSDFQDPGDAGSSNPTTSSANVRNILNKVKTDHPTAKGFIFCGDYDKNWLSTNATNSRIAALKSTVSGVFSDIKDENNYMVLVKGNHDNQDANYTSSGAHDTADYGVFVINEKDYQWASNGISQTTIQATANNLGNYLDEKIEDGYTKPIFVVSHVPLHYSARTYYDGDGCYAKYIFDELQAAGDELTIIFLYGHDHSNGWDNYLGGAASYLPVGHEFYVSAIPSTYNQAGRAKYTVETLKFTYMNAGFVGYYADREPDNDMNSGVDKTKTMSVFTITGSDVTIERYDANGAHSWLKGAGCGSVYRDESKCSSVDGSRQGIPPFADVIYNPQIINLKSQTRFDFEDHITGIKIVASAGTAASAASITNNTVFPDISKSVSFDISVEGFTNGTDTATVSIPLPSGYKTNLTRVYHVDGDTLTDMNARLVDGYLVFDTDHFSEYMVGEISVNVDDWIPVFIPGETTYEYTLVTTVTSGEEYLIAAPSNAYILNGNNGISRRSVTINNNKIILDTDIYDWTFEANGTNYRIYNEAGYLRINNNTLLIGNSSSTNRNWTVTLNSGYNRIKNASGNHYIQYDGTTFKRNRNASNLRLFQLTNTITINSDEYYLGIAGDTAYSFSTSRFADSAALEAYLRSNIKVCKADDTNGTNIQFINYTLTANGTVDPTQAGNATYTVTAEGRTLGTVSVEFVAKTATDISFNTNGWVYRGASANAAAHSNLTVTFDDNSTELVPITLNMLSGSFDRNNIGTYDNLTVNYGDMTADGYTLEVFPHPEENDYPEYPDGGSVKVGKTGMGVNFPNTGVAQIELTAAGVPVNKGVDVIVMVDTSSSMNYPAKAGNTAAGNGEKQRIEYLRDSLTAMLEKFSAPNEDGSASDIRLALADFNGYRRNNQYLISNMDKIDSTNSGGHGAPTSNIDAGVFTGNNTISAGAFEQVGGYETADINTLVDQVKTKSGTNFDYAFDTVYRLAYAIKQENALNGEERDLYVIFMSDGCPYQYNYYLGYSEDARWNTYLTGGYTAQNVLGTNHKNFYNAETANTHRMADAIKGSPDDTFTVISPTADLPGAAATSESYMYTVNGLGATMYAIGFCVYTDQDVTDNTIRTVISRVATDSDHYFEVQGSESGDYQEVQANLDNAFTQISSDIRLAATNASFIDTIGEDYDLQRASVINDANPPVDLNTYNIIPTIIYREYDVYKLADVNNTTVTESMVGQRNGNFTDKETVSFNNDGTEAYSSLNPGVNILTNGVISAHNFWYNTSTTASATIVDNGVSVSLAPETFYWKIGTIREKEYALRYYVYLTDSMQGTRDAGMYPTNESATLYYTNWLGHEAHQDTVSPVLPWGDGAVRYAFYLVNADGQPVNSDGNVVPFAQRQTVLDPTLFANINLNNGGTVDVSAVNTDIPDEYSLYDTSSAYSLVLYSGDLNGEWDITHDPDMTDSVYVTNYDHTNPNAYRNTDSNSESGVDYSNTIVWFAVMRNIRCAPDIVVVDFGLPVDIDVLSNDPFGSFGTLNGIIDASAVEGLIDNGYTSEKHETSTTANPNLKFGSASVAAEGSYITYTPGDLQMHDVEVFGYEVCYENGSSELNGYYYGTVTVVPATLIYYEDSFKEGELNGIVFTNGTNSNKDGAWTSATDSTGKGKKQKQDRPGTNNLPHIDANNLYGFDNAYEDCKEYSLYNAKKVTVSSKTQEGNWPTAKFTFTGTGFDLISVTNKDTGFIKVEVYKTGEVNADGSSVTPVTRELVKTWGVDTFYGYTHSSDPVSYVKYTWTYENAKWRITTNEEVAEPETYGKFPKNPKDGDTFFTWVPKYEWTLAEDSDALYQIPVIKCYNQLDYAQYEVVITPTYNTYLNHNKGKDSYDFYFDAVRIYNPAENSDRAQDVYRQDNEAYPEYLEIRDNLIAQSGFDPDDIDLNNQYNFAVFIDGLGTYNDVFSYEAYGPNNEVYLLGGQSVAFRLTADDKNNIASIQLGAKCVNTEVNIAIKTINSDGTVSRNKEMSLATSTDMFYNISDVVQWQDIDNASKIIVITNNSASGTIVSLTQIKCTFKTDPSPAAPDMSFALAMSRADAILVQDVLRSAYVDGNTSTEDPVIDVPVIEDPVVDDPIVEDPEEVITVFEPSVFELKLPKGAVKKGKNAVITINTSEDVASVMVNGQLAVFKRMDKKTGNKVWEYSYTASAKGSYNIEVVAYNADNVASQSIINVLNVK